jgi:glycosyltransferase involved in cell wall biosynthesis
MRVNIEVSSLSSNNLTGIGVYVQNLIRHLSTFENIELEGCYRVSRWKHYKIIKQNAGLRILRPIISNVPQLFLDNDILIHGPDYWLPNIKKAKKVVTIHDFSVFHGGLWSKDFAESGQRSIHRLLTKIKPEHVIVVSNFVKNELLERFPMYENKVTTIYHGADHFGQIQSTIKKPKDIRPYIICLGTIEFRKNQISLVKAFDMIQKEYQDVSLLIVGGKGGYKGTEISEAIKKYKNVSVLNYVSKSELNDLLANALFSVYPSLYEGFGFPILESMALGTPVLTSNFGAMKEIANDAALFANTTEIDDIAKNLQRMLDDSVLRNRLRAEGLERVRQFSWTKCAKNTLSVYQKTIAQ